MYSFIKSILRKLLPLTILYRLEPVLRNIHYYLFYRGHKYHCPICDRQLSQFIPLPSGDLKCPSCGSLGRDRRLFLHLKSHLISSSVILDFSPSRCLFRFLSGYPNISYLATDFDGSFVAQHKFDITHIALDDQSIDLIICYHILEHIDDDITAMKELYRILKTNGICLIQTPFKDGAIYENPAVLTPMEKVQHFGQKDHVRIYSAEGLTARLESVGFTVKIHTFLNDIDNENGYAVNEIILEAVKI